MAKKKKKEIFFKTDRARGIPDRGLFKKISVGAEIPFWVLSP